MASRSRLRSGSALARTVPRGRTLVSLLFLLFGLHVGLVAGSASAQSGVVLASDDFDRADEQPLAVGGSWQEAIVAGGTVDLVGNRIVGAGGDAVYFWQGAGDFDPARQFARARVVVPSPQVGLVVRGGPGQALIGAWNNALGVVYLYWYSEGVYRGNLAVGSSTLQVDDVIEVALLGGVVYAKVNGIVVASAADTTGLAAGSPGLEVFQPGGSLDDWEAGTPDAFTISGAAREAGVGVEGVLVRASGAYAAIAATDANGAYSLTNVPSGATAITLTANAAGFDASPLTRTLTGPVAGDITGEDFALTPSDNAVVARDGFDRPNESSFVTGGAWQKVLADASTARLEEGRVVGVIEDAVYFWQGPGTFDAGRQYARATVVDPSGQVGLVVLGAPGQAVIGAWDDSIATVFLYWYEAGIYRGNLAVGSSTLEAGDTIEVELLDGVVYAKRNGVVVASAVNSTGLASGRPGFETYLAGGRLDDWEAGTPVAHTISGRISEGGSGLPGVFVRASGRYGATTSTDANGDFVFTGVPGGDASIVLTPTLAGYDFTPASRTIPVPVSADVLGQDFAATPSTGAVVATDDFDRPDEAPFVVGDPWQKAISGSARAQLRDGALVGDFGDAIYYWDGPGSFDVGRQYARARVVDPDGQIGLVLLGGPGQALIAAWGNPPGTVYLYWYSENTYRGNLMIGPAPLQAGDTIEAELLDGVFYAKVNGVVVASAVNTTTLASGRPGIETFQVGGALDDWEAGTPTAWSISGSVRAGGVGLPDVLVRATGRYGATAVTDANGAYTLPGVPSGAASVVLTALAAGYDMTPTSRTVTGPIAGDVVGEDFTATASGNAIVAADSFDRPPEIPLVVGGVWEKAIAGSARARLVDERIVGETGDAIYFWQGPGSFDSARQVARARVVEPNEQVGLVVLGGPGQALVAAWNEPAGAVYLYWFSGGVPRGNLLIAPSTLQAGDAIEAELLGGVFRAKVNGVVVASVANTTTLASGRPGFETFGANGSLDDWEAATPTATACADGLDNDGDGLVDLLDPGCSDVDDPSEQNPAVACDDGLDNDGDALVDLADPGCTDPSDPSEENVVTIACSDGLDNDGDGLVDLADPGCADANDESEQNAAVACDDGLDNDGDGLVDLLDPGCADGTDASEQNAAVACDDGLDNDGDGLVDLLDPGCAGGADASELNEAIACDDGIDNDGDTLIDWPDDPDCDSASDASEGGAPTPVPALPPTGLLLLLAALLGTAAGTVVGRGGRAG